MAVPADAERIYIVGPEALGDKDILPKWLNEPEGPRVPGPHPIPKPDRMQVGSGFPPDLPRPIIDFSRTVEGRRAHAKTPIYEAYNLSIYWVVSQAVRNSLSAIDPTGFDAVPVEVRLWDGSIGPPYWLMELVRFSDCFDSDRSRESGVPISANGVANFGVGAPDGSIFRSEILGKAAFFRTPRNSLTCLCPEQTKLAVTAAGHTKIRFFAIGWLV